VAAACRQAGADVAEHRVDVTDRTAMAAWIEGADRQAPLDLVIANAGIAGTQLPPGPERTRTIFRVNLGGVLNTIEPAQAAMLARGRGHLALMSSLASFRGFPNAPAYCSSKAAVRFLGESLRERLGRGGIVVSVICPGFVATPMTADNRFSMPLLMSPERAAAIIERGLARGKARIAFPLGTYWGVRLLAVLPRRPVDRLAARAPAKE
ncbi:MAG: SDR family NAD(P)-dependent oxidoreductase, partial [Alphaproteobacteria bacterium]